ncbi:MAG TPA: hypothetical protein VLD65_05965 [Anaerolineales bacterium]|nr:hypothetical protein [Anaerolineales bacterium]
MKIIKRGMRVWITVASLFSFFGGWILLAHANKPAPLQYSQPAISAPASSPSIQTINPSIQSGGFSFPSQSFPTFSRPMLRTGGS